MYFVYDKCVKFVNYATACHQLRRNDEVAINGYGVIAVVRLCAVVGWVINVDGASIRVVFLPRLRVIKIYMVFMRRKRRAWSLAAKVGGWISTLFCHVQRTVLLTNFHLRNPW